MTSKPYIQEEPIQNPLQPSGSFKKVDSFDMFAQIQKSGMTEDEAMQVLYKDQVKQKDGIQFGKKKKAIEQNIAQLEKEAKQVLSNLNQSKLVDTDMESEARSKIKKEVEAAFQKKGYSNMDWLD